MCCQYWSGGTTSCGLPLAAGTPRGDWPVLLRAFAEAARLSLCGLSGAERSLATPLRPEGRRGGVTGRRSLGLSPLLDALSWSSLSCVLRISRNSLRPVSSTAAALERNCWGALLQGCEARTAYSIQHTKLTHSSLTTRIDGGAC